ncbi:glycosyltransferase family 39 protein [Chloroflexi bacterium TSY]|nr:glycosyltransferase family 39 protein [Chloroflexi bacterium TSY]
MSTRRFYFGSLIACVTLNIFLWLDISQLLRAAISLLLVGGLPGLLIVRFWLSPQNFHSVSQKSFLSHLTSSNLVRQRRNKAFLGVIYFLETVVFTIATGYSIIVFVMLGLAYLPGGISEWQILFVSDLLIIGLWTVSWRWESKRPKSSSVLDQASLFEQENTEHAQHDSQFREHDLLGFRPSNVPHSLVDDNARANASTLDYSLALIGLLFLLVIGSFLRFTNLGYHEFHNDEARAALRAAAVLQGYEDVLLIHKKGPTEILVPAAIYALTGQLNEASARLPFAIANLAGLAALFLLGTRLFGPLAGATATFLLTFDGYFIGFARIVQYQSIVFLTSIVAVLLLCRLVRHPIRIVPTFGLVGLIWATGLLSHYEAIVVIIPLLYLLFLLLYYHSQQRSTIVLASAFALLLGTFLLALFYLPYSQHPQFQATYTYLTERRIGGDSLPYNNLADVFQRTTLYSSTYYVLLLALLTVSALAWLIQYQFSSRSEITTGHMNRLGWLFGTSVVLIGIITILFVRPEWFLVGELNLTFLPFLLLFLPAWSLPKVSHQERIVWLWFGLLFLGALFAVLKPRTHVYIFFIPWALLAGVGASRIWCWMREQLGERWATLAGLSTVLLLASLFGNYAYWYFVHHEVEVLRTWPENRPRGYWTAYAEPDKRALFGFPSNNGWKVIGYLYAKGELNGSYESNELEAWGPAWYTRGQTRCKHGAQWYFQTVGNLEPFYDFQRVAMEDYLSKGFVSWGQVNVNGVHKMTIHQRSETPPDQLRILHLSDHETSFDQAANAMLPLTYPAVNAPIPNILHQNLSNLFWLEGYEIAYPTPLAPGDTIRLTLFWRAQQSTNETYKIFNQSFYGNGTMVAQRDAYPVCGNRDTWQWDPGELITDVHEIPVKDDAPDGLYPLYTGMYLESTGERLKVLDEAGNVAGDWVHLTDIRIGPE